MDHRSRIGRKDHGSGLVTNCVFVTDVSGLNICSEIVVEPPINIYPDAVPPIHAESYHVATDKDPSK